ncbi:hypothetical protein GQ53DRAFT_354439 [Thozetella sp. PMI_491]|nr:hypothetical protein GQ53DRAFT_354439 [Thozetella sp. PMI_491]
MPQIDSTEGPSSPPGESVSKSPDAPVLTATQLHALFDVLTHHQTYTEVERFKLPNTIAGYGYPFGTAVAGEEVSHAPVSSAPLLASLFRPVVLPIPGVRDLPLEFWNARFQGILATLGEADLSESYDKGTLGTRKTLATAASVVHESVSRGCLGGVPQGGTRDLHGTYDSTQASEVVRAWDDVIHELVYGSLVDELFDYAAEKGSLEEHSPAVQLAVDYIIIHMATFMHHMLVLSPEGPYLLKLMENVHRLVPYAMVKQTLRIGNAATMLNGILKLFLAKMSVGAVSNWLGITEKADDGMNLLQRIISLVLSWDSSEFRKAADKIERAKGGPSKAHLASLKRFVDQPREDHEAARKRSMEKKISIVAAILGEDADPDLLSSLSAEQHTQCLEYYSAQLSIRDRDQITKALCAQNPDIFTQIVRDLAACFEPMIRTIHERVDLRDPLTAAESFLNDLILTSKSQKPAASYSLWRRAETKGTAAPSVEDFVNLIRRNRQFVYDWLHQLAEKCPETAGEFRTWAKEVIRMFQAQRPPSPTAAAPQGLPNGTNEQRPPCGRDERRAGAAGSQSGKLQAMFMALPPETRETVLASLDAHADYLSSLEDLSMRRMQHVLDNLAVAEDAGDDKPASEVSMSGPGMFLSRWQSLLDSTAITPGAAGGAVRSGKEVKGTTSEGKTGALPSKDSWDAAAIAAEAEKEVPQAPDVHVVVAALGGGFEELLIEGTRS